MSDTRQMRSELRSLRHDVAGKTFDEWPEAFKDIESLKVRIAKLEPPKPAKAQHGRRQPRERRK